MTPSTRKNELNLSAIATAVLALGAVISIFGVINRVSSTREKNAFFKTSSTERDLAIANAKKTGETNYSYQSSFTPGLGTITDPASYQKQWEDNAKKLLGIKP